MKSKRIFTLIFILLIFKTANAGFFSSVKKLTSKIKKSKRIAVSYIYNAETGDITALGNLWRDRIEEALNKLDFTVVPRMDVGILIEDIESFGMGKKEGEIWSKIGADVVICGKYYIHPSHLELYLKAFDTSKGVIIGAASYKEKLEEGWVRLESRIKGNLYQRKLKEITPSSTGPRLEAHLDRSPPCYSPGSPARIFVSTEKGVHVYIIGLQEDNTAVLLYPNRFFPDKPLVTGRLDFPPRGMKSISLKFYPMHPDKPTHEAIKVIASYHSIDLSWLPVPENAIYTGLKGGNIGKLYRQLRQEKGWSEVLLEYWVGKECSRR